MSRENFAYTDNEAMTTTGCIINLSSVFTTLPHNNSRMGRSWMKVLRKIKHVHNISQPLLDSGCYVFCLDPRSFHNIIFLFLIYRDHVVVGNTPSPSQQPGSYCSCGTSSLASTASLLLGVLPSPGSSRDSSSLYALPRSVQLALSVLAPY